MIKKYGILLDGRLKQEASYGGVHIFDKKNGENIIQFMKENNHYNVTDFKLVPLKATFILHEEKVQAEIVDYICSYVNVQRTEKIRVKTVEHGYLTLNKQDCIIEPHNG